MMLVGSRRARSENRKKGWGRNNLGVNMFSKQALHKIEEYLWEIPKNYRPDMRVPARFYTDERMLEDTLKDRSLEQLVNISTLPGIYKYALAMPDIHEGFGVPIGGVFATDIENDGIISPGAVGYDINCGIRLLTTEVTFDEAKTKIEDLARAIYATVPAGLGRGGGMKLSDQELNEVMTKGTGWAVANGYGTNDDLEMIEENGCMAGANPSHVSQHASSRGRDQLGTVGSGNHFAEIQRVEEIYDENIAKTFGLFPNQITILVHTGSRGFGHQVASDYIHLMQKAMTKYEIKIPDRELACAPFQSDEGQAYFQAHGCAINYAFANRQIIVSLIRKVWQRFFSDTPETLYEVAHNIAKIESYDGKKLLIHRKGATRAFGADRPEVPEKYRAIGQPVIIPGSMGTASFVSIGTKKAESESFGSTSHGAGRVMSRGEAKRSITGQELFRQLKEQGVLALCRSPRGLLEEAPAAYKDIDRVVNVVHKAGISLKIAKLKPLGVIKGG